MSFLEAMKGKEMKKQPIKRHNDIVAITDIETKKICNRGTDLHQLTSFFHDRNLAYPVNILYKSTAGRYQPVRPVRVADGLITVRCRFIKNAIWLVLI